MSPSTIAPEEHELDLCLPARPESAATLRAALRRFLERSRLCTTRRFDVMIAVGEASSNAIEHAYRGADGTVRLFVRHDHSVLVVEIHDGGVWRHDGDPDRGRGLGIMRTLMDTVEIVTTNAGTTVRLGLGADRFVA